jgi:hypothetical protein
VRVGSHAESGGLESLQGSRIDIWGTSDSFYFNRSQLDAARDFSAEMCAATFNNGQMNSRGGIMLRKSLAPDAANAFVGAEGQWKVVVSQSRAAAGARTVHHQMIWENWANTFYIRLNKAGTVATASFKVDEAEEWTVLRSMELTFTGSVLVPNHGPTTMAAKSTVSTVLITSDETATTVAVTTIATSEEFVNALIDPNAAGPAAAGAPEFVTADPVDAANAEFTEFPQPNSTTTVADETDEAAEATAPISANPTGVKTTASVTVTATAAKSDMFIDEASGPTTHNTHRDPTNFKRQPQNISRVSMKFFRMLVLLLAIETICLVGIALVEAVKSFVNLANEASDITDAYLTQFIDAYLSQNDEWKIPAGGKSSNNDKHDALFSSTPAKETGAPALIQSVTCSRFSCRAPPKKDISIKLQ